MRSSGLSMIFAAALIAVGTLAGTLVAAQDSGGAGIAFPQDYRSWTHVKSMIIQPGHPLADPFQGIHHVYANDIALKGYETGEFADGSILVFDLLKYVEAEDTIQEDARVLVGVMKKSAADYATTDGWGYEGFAGDSKTERLVTDRLSQCHGCHVGTADTGFVFSRLRK